MERCIYTYDENDFKSWSGRNIFDGERQNHQRRDVE